MSFKIQCPHCEEYIICSNNEDDFDNYNYEERFHSYTCPECERSISETEIDKQRWKRKLERKEELEARKRYKEYWANHVETRMPVSYHKRAIYLSSHGYNLNAVNKTICFN